MSNSHQSKRVLSEKGKKGKIFHKKEFPENVVAGRNIVCDRHTARQALFVLTLAC
jgi:hypothetical protein